MDDPTLIILMYFIIPIWFVAGIVDWFCHRRSNISGTSGAKESLIHLLMFAEVGIPLFMVLIFEVNSLIIAISILLFFVHEATAMWDVSYAVSKRRVGPIEQHVHSFLEMIPLLALVLVVVVIGRILLRCLVSATFLLTSRYNLKKTPYPHGI